MPERPSKTIKTGHFGVLSNKSSGTNISVHAGSALPSCFGTPPRKTDYAGVLQHRCPNAVEIYSPCSE